MRYIQILSLLICMLISPAYGQLFNSKPTAYPDTCRGKLINVLANDVDDNGDPLTVTKFNGVAISNTAISVKKSDTGIFILRTTGELIFVLDSGFYGTVHLTYYVNDGKGSTAKRQTGSIVVIHDKPTGELKPHFMYIIRNNDSCKYSSNLKYWVEVIYAGDTFPAYCWKNRGYYLLSDTSGGKIHTIRQSGWHYKIRFTGRKGESMTLFMEEEDFIYIEENACKE